MFSYRHAFHAGNHADVLKHTVLLAVLRGMLHKPKAISLIDTHSGPGMTHLTTDYAQISGEAESGIQLLWARLQQTNQQSSEPVPAAVQHYLAALTQFDPSRQRYPGSPWLLQQQSRVQDRLHLCERHPSDKKRLLQAIDGMKAMHDKGQGAQPLFEDRDAWLLTKALLPPPSRRGLVFIDPPYEDKADYRKVITAVEEGVSRFANGVYVIWYPLLARQDSQSMSKQLKKRLPTTIDILDAGFDLRGTTDMQLKGSGMLVVNPPYGVAEQLAQAVPWLASQLAMLSATSPHEAPVWWLDNGNR